MACSYARIGLLAGFTVALASGMSAAPALAQKAETIALCKAEKSEKGIAACTAVLKGRGDLKVRASALLARAQAYWALNRLAEAEKDYNETIRLVPNFGALYRDRGQIRFGLSNQPGAMADFDVALDKDPFDADNHANRGYLKMLQYDFEGAREDFRKGIFWQKEHPRSHYMMGLLHYSTGQYREAVAAIGQARALGFKGNEAFITKARSHFYLNAYDLAEREASDGLAVFPTVYDLSEIRARARLAQNKMADALADAESVVQVAPRYGRAFATRAAVKLAMKDLTGARADADKAIELDPNLFDATKVKAEILLQDGDKAGARALYAQSAARTDAKMAHDKTSKAVAAAWVVELDAPPPIIVAELGEAELKTRCGNKDDPLRMQSCDRLVETATTPPAKADMLLLRSKARPFGERLGDLDLAVAAAPDYLVATLARAQGHLALFAFGTDLGPYERAWADADSVVRRAAAGSKEREQALAVRAHASHGKGDYEAAIVDLTEMVALGASEPYALEMRGSALLMAGRPAAALADLREMRRIITDRRRLVVQQGDFVLALIENGNIDEALTVIEAWVRDDPGGSFSRDALRARALLMRGDVTGAQALAATAVATNQLNLGALAVRGIASARLGNALDAVSDIGAVIEAGASPFKAATSGLTPGFVAELYLQRGLTRVQLRQINAARADFSEAIRRAPDLARAYAERARLALRADNPAALTDIAMALRIEPNEPRWQALAARINLATGDNAAAERFANAALAAPAPEPDLLLLRARARIGLGKFGEAAQDATARLAAAPSDTEALLVRIEARTGQGDLKAALADAEAARSAQGGDARILLALAELKARSGDAPGAIGAFEEAAGKPDAALQANKRLGDLYAGIASDQLALGYYAKAIEQPARRPADEALKAAARTARDALIRKMAAPK